MSPYGRLLPEALAQLEENVRAVAPVMVRTVPTDLADFTFDQPANLVVAFSALEHLPDVPSIKRLTTRMATAVAPGGVAAVVMFVDRCEITGDGHRPSPRPSTDSPSSSNGAPRPGPPRPVATTPSC